MPSRQMGFDSVSKFDFEFDFLGVLMRDVGYVRGIRNLLVLALFIAYIGIAYTLPGAYAGERASLLTAHLRASGLKDSARIL
jgi:hypothetical protein